MKVICSFAHRGNHKEPLRKSPPRKHEPRVGCGVDIVWELMRSYLENFVESLFPWWKRGSGKTSLGVWTVCTWCEGRGYLKKNANGWRACPECYGGHFWIPPSPHEEEFAVSGLSQNKKNVRSTS